MSNTAPLFHLVDDAGRVVYNRLHWDASRGFYRFDSGFGFVTLEVVTTRRLTALEGWA